MLQSLFWAAALLSTAALAAPKPEKDYFFDNIPASQDLKWYPCNKTFECARLSVPLNPLDQHNGLRSEIPLIKLAANKSDEYKGIVLTNSGGPGGLGIGYILSRGITIQNFTGPGWDIIGFDPRGMGYSVPNGATGFGNTTFEPNRMNATYISPEKILAKRHSSEDNYGLRIPIRNDAWVQDLYNQSMLLNEHLKTIDGDNQALAYMGTPNVAFDMLQIAKADARSKGLAEEDALVNYYGVSYGTALGQTFAALYPEKVGRFVVDSVLDLEAWYSGNMATPGYTFPHADEGFAEFFKDCFNAGPELCSFHNGSASPEALLERFNAIMSVFDVNKAISEGWSNITDVSLGLEFMKQIFLLVPYSGLYNFPALADTFVSVEYLIATQNVTAENMSLIFLQWAPPADAAAPERPENIFECWCSDTYNKTVSSGGKPLPQALIDSVRNQSVVTGERLILLYGICTHLDLKPKFVFNRKIGGKTKNPILFIGVTMDPITPFENAERATKLHEGAQMLYIEGVGHGLIGLDNWCAYDKTRTYFQNGTLPGDDNFCPRVVPFVNMAAPSNPGKRDLSSLRHKPMIPEWVPSIFR
ncbi:hypothetical protein ABW19_dt0206431 [Dactylella cylindrospora]|nr:hypothetical protein ABW19_dt0206431 [Dactylella cylindrospora]